jgi:hypothetical protein
VCSTPLVTASSTSPIDSAAAASAVFAKVYDSDLCCVLSMLGMWCYCVPPVPLDWGLILKAEFVDPRKESVESGNTQVSGSEGGGGKDTTETSATLGPNKANNVN